MDMTGRAMSNFQKLAVNPIQSGPSNECLTGCMYQVVQSSLVQGKNVLQLIPLLNTKDNPVPAVSSPIITNTPVVNVPQPVRFALPPAISNVTLPCPVNAQLVQQIGSANYIITTQKNPADASKTIRVDNKFSTHQNTAVVLEKSQLSLPSNSQPGTPSFIIMNPKPASVPVKTFPFFPSGHGLQIPANAEVKSVPASSLPFSLQQRILPPNTSIETPKIPSVIYVSPVNTVKTPPALPKLNNSTMATLTKASPLNPILIPALNPSTPTPPKGPLKWVVQENKESKSCIVPVKSSNETASKILALMSGAKTEELNLPAPTSSNTMKVKDNSLVMCNNKIYFLTKPGTELRSTVQIKQESTDQPPLETDQGKDLANKVVEVVLSKNSLSPPNVKQTLTSGNSLLNRPDVASPAKPKACTPHLASKSVPEVIYIDDDDDDDDVPVSIQKPQGIPHYQPKETPAKVYTPSTSLGGGPCSQDHQVRDKVAEVMEIPKAPVPRVCDDRTLRAKFGFFKKEKIILNRIPLLRPQSRSDSRSPQEDMMVYTGSQEKRKSTYSETCNMLKRRKSADGSDFNMNSELAGDFSRSSFPTTVPASAGSSDTRHTTSGTCRFLPLNESDSNTAYGHPSTSHSSQNSGPEMYTDPIDSPSFYVDQDITGHFSEAPLPRQRFQIESSVYTDETTKDEKIQRLKEVLKEREQALEVLRRQKWS